MSQQNNNSGGGIGLLGAVFIVFLVLKLVGTIDWSWWWVFAPLWAPLVIGLTLVGVVFLFAGIGYLIVGGCDMIAKKLTKKKLKR